MLRAGDGATSSFGGDPDVIYRPARTEILEQDVGRAFERLGPDRLNQLVGGRVDVRVRDLAGSLLVSVQSGDEVRIGPHLPAGVEAEQRRGNDGHDGSVVGRRQRDVVVEDDHPFGADARHSVIRHEHQVDAIQQRALA